jgi:hypothetical protein
MPRRLRVWIAIGLCVWLAACAAPSGVTGRWRETDKPATLEFRADGAFRAVDHQGMAVEGLYTLEPGGRVRFTIPRAGEPPEVIPGILRVEGNRLTLVFPDSGETGTYRRVP